MMRIKKTSHISLSIQNAGIFILRKFRSLLFNLNQRFGSQKFHYWLNKTNIWIEDTNYQRWQQLNAQQNFADFYVSRQIQLTNALAPHPTLGKNLINKQPFNKQGFPTFQFLKKQGVLPHHTVVDYGCGGLRIGQHLINYLNKAQYVGMDISDHFYKIGLEMIPPDLVAQKQPHLYKITTKNLQKIRNLQPDFIFSFAVALHVPPTELANYLQNIFSLAKPQTIILIHLLTAENTTRISADNWAHSQSDFSKQLAKTGRPFTFFRQKRASHLYNEIPSLKIPVWREWVYIS